MKKTSTLLIAAAVMLSSCGITARYASSDDGHKFQDGIYGNSPSFITKEEKDKSQKETQDLVDMTKSSQIYLFGDKKDTIAIPENWSARIQFDQKVGGTIVTVGENPYDWRWDLENNYGYYYGPYSLGASWYWRNYGPYWNSWGYGPYWDAWRYHSPWYYSSFYSPWHYNSFYDPWYCSGWYDPWYHGSYWRWHDPWHHHHGWYNPHHHHHHGPGHVVIKPEKDKNRWHGLRAHTVNGPRDNRPATNSGKTTIRRGIGTSSSTGRTASISRGSSSVGRSATTNRSAATRTSAPTYRRPAATTGSQQNENSSGYTRGSGNSYSRGSSGSNSNNTMERSSGYSRSSSSYNSGYSRSQAGDSGFSRSSSSSSGGGSYSRGSSSGGSYRR